MDLLKKPLSLNLYDDNRRIYCRNAVKPPHYVSAGAKISNSLVPEGCEILGTVSRSVLFPGVYIGKGSRVTDSVIFPNARIGRNCIINKTLVCDNTVVEDGCEINNPAGEKADCVEYVSEFCSGGISLIASDVRIAEGSRICPNSMVENNVG